MGAPVQFNATPVSACSRCLSWVGSLCVQFHHWQLRRSSSALPVSLSARATLPFPAPELWSPPTPASYEGGTSTRSVGHTPARTHGMGQWGSFRT